MRPPARERRAGGAIVLLGTPVHDVAAVIGVSEPRLIAAQAASDRNPGLGAQGYMIALCRGRWSVAAAPWLSSGGLTAVAVSRFVTFCRRNRMMPLPGPVGSDRTLLFFADR